MKTNMLPKHLFFSSLFIVLESPVPLTIVNSARDFLKLAIGMRMKQSSVISDVYLLNKSKDFNFSVVKIFIFYGFENYIF